MSDEAPNPSDRFERSFMATLVQDVIVADAHRDVDDNQSNRRNLVRTTFAAIEGLVWVCREHVREVAKSLGEITPLIDMALRELTYTVSDRGELIEQIRYVTLPAMIRLTVRQAQRLAPDLQVDFGEQGWAKLRDAIIIRNNVTHPKSNHDLEIGTQEIDVIRNAFHWVLSLTEDVLSTTVAVQAVHNRDMREILEALKRKDPAMLLAYQQALAQLDQDE